jgi:hypothetical protein
MTTEDTVGQDGVVIGVQKSVWTGADQGSAWKERPLPVSISRNCAFRSNVLKALDRMKMNWTEVASPDNIAVVEALTSADFCVSVELEHTVMTGRVIIDHKGLLPELPEYKIIVYGPVSGSDEIHAIMAEYLRSGYAH